MYTNLFIHEIYLSYRVETEYSILDFQSVSYKVQPQINFQGCVKSLAFTESNQTLKKWVLWISVYSFSF